MPTTIGPATSIGQPVVDRLVGAVDGRAGDGRDQEQEGDAGGRVPVEAEVAGGGDRDSGAGGAGRQRQHLGEADVEAVPDRQAVDVPRLRQPVGPAEKRAEDDQLDADHPGLAEVVLDEVRAEPACDHRGDRADRDRHRDALVDGLDRAPAGGPEEGGEIGGHLVAEVRDRGDQGSGVERDVEGLVELLVVLQERVVLKPGDEDEVPGGGDRQELGEPLDDPQQEGLQFGHRRGILVAARLGLAPRALAPGLKPGVDEAGDRTIAAASPCLKWTCVEPASCPGKKDGSEPASSIQ